MRIILFCLLSGSATAALCQTISATQQKALNNYLLYADHSVEEMSSIVVSVIKYYPTISQNKRNATSIRPRYVCPIQLGEYYYKIAITESNSLGSSNASMLNKRINDLKSAAEKIDANCKALDTYHKLEDYKQDNLAGAETMIRKFPAFFKEYKEAERVLINEVNVVYKKFGINAEHVNQKAIEMMRRRLDHENAFLDLWKYNLEEDVPTGWPSDKLAESILQTDKLIKESSQKSLPVKYPASGMYSSFNEGMTSILESKRMALDGYNADAKKSDRHGNSAYLTLINYYNGVLVAFYNSFIDYAQQDGFRGLKVVRYMPEFEIRDKPSMEKFQIVPFHDVVQPSLNVPSQASPIVDKSAVVLNTYVDFINECVRQAKFLHLVVRNLSVSADSYRGLTSFQGRGGLYYNYDNYKPPLSLYQKVISESVNLKPEFAKHLNVQAEVIMSIMKEMEQLSEALQRSVDEKQYEKDHLKYLDEIFSRYRFLFEVFDDRKEMLYDDVRKVYDAYPLKNTNDNWIISWKALRQLVDDDHAALFQAKEFYKEKTKAIPGTTSMDEHLREVLTNEYDNMKGIEKYGRSNGLCPYTPYEDIPKSSRSLSDKIKKMKEVKSNLNQHPYNDLVYLYNEVVRDFNKFSELSKRNLLKTINQPEWIEIRYSGNHVATSVNHGQASVIVAPASDVTETKPTMDNSKTAVVVSSQTANKIVHDTVYIEKRDTIYLTDTDENLRSMEGYATNNMVLLLDVSGSMNAPEKLPLLKTSVLNLLNMMRQEDQVSIVIYSGKAKVLLQPTSFKDEEKVRKAINELTSSGKTDGNAGIKLAYQVADKNYVRGGNNRIILATDGEFPISEDVFSLAEKFSKEDIFISVFNFGKTTSFARNLERLSSKGKGNYEHITKENMELKLIHEAKSKKAK